MFKGYDSCLRTFQNIVKSKGKRYEANKIMYETVLSLESYFIKGEEYKRKKETIREWMEKDRRKQDFYDNTVAPVISCPTCDTRLYSDYKILEDCMDRPMRVLFFFSCKTCKKNRAFYNNGEERVSQSPRCPKCSSIVKETEKLKKNTKIIMWTKNCTFL
jgi:hypothetical protein